MLATTRGSEMAIAVGRRPVWERPVRLLLGDDIFISYSRADGAGYAARLAGELTRDGLSCGFDQWGACPGGAARTRAGRIKGGRVRAARSLLICCARSDGVGCSSW